MKSILPLLIAAAAVLGADKKPLPNQAGNDNIELVGTLLMDRQDIQQAVGADMGPGYIVVRIKATPKGDGSLRAGPDDFTLLSRKDGERSPALAPSQIAGQGALVVKSAATQPGGDGTRTNGPIWGGVSVKSDSSAPSPLLALLAEKIFPDKETKTSVEGLLYFLMDGKTKAKDITLLFNGQAGRLVMDFK